MRQLTKRAEFSIVGMITPGIILLMLYLMVANAIAFSSQGAIIAVIVVAIVLLLRRK